LGCIFHYIGISEATDYNWLEIYHLYDEPWAIRYINSVYWAVTTMITVGYGDLSPQTPLERLFGVFFLLVACGVFSFTMNTIGNTM
jgi:hyperpolarization activated cyclic nucleotide-gated potassium channel 2